MRSGLAITQLNNAKALVVMQDLTPSTLHSAWLCGVAAARHSPRHSDRLAAVLDIRPITPEGREVVGSRFPVVF